MSKELKETKYMYLLQYYTYLYISGIRLVAKGHKMVSDGWVLFEKTAEETALGELRQLLQSLKMSTTPPATPTTPTKVKQEEEEAME